MIRIHARRGLDNADDITYAGPYMLKTLHVESPEDARAQVIDLARTHLLAPDVEQIPYHIYLDGAESALFFGVMDRDPPPGKIICKLVITRYRVFEDVTPS